MSSRNIYKSLYRGVGLGDDFWGCARLASEAYWGIRRNEQGEALPKKRALAKPTMSFQAALKARLWRA